MSHEVVANLAETEHGRVTLCACGCIHLTFGLVTLHFEEERSFVRMADVVLDEERSRGEGEEFDLRYDWFSMSLSPYGSAQFAHLVREAVNSLAWASGEMEFTDEDLRRMRRDAEGE